MVDSLGGGQASAQVGPRGRGQALVVSWVVLASLAVLPPTLALVTTAVAALFLGIRVVGRRERVAIPLVVTLAVAAILMVVVELPLIRRSASGASLLRAVENSYSEVIESLNRQSQAIARSTSIPSSSETARQTAFERLAEALEQQPGPGATAVLVDADGLRIAWVGEGLRHDLPEGRGLPVDGIGFVKSLTAVTLFAVTPLEEGSRPWRVIASQSFSTLVPPFVRPRPRARLAARRAKPVRDDLRFPLWTLHEQTPEATGGPEMEAWTDVVAPDRPTLRVRSSLLAQLAGDWSTWLWWLLAIGVGLTGLVYGLRAFEHGGQATVGRSIVHFGLLSLLAVGWAHNASFASLGTLLGGAGAMWLALDLRGRRSQGWRPVWIGLAVGVSLLIALVLAKSWPAAGLGLDGLGASFWLNADGWLQRLGLWSLVCSPFLIRGRQKGGERWFWLSLLLLGTAGASRGQPWIAAALLVVAVWLLSRWKLDGSRGGDYAALGLVTVLLSATVCAVGGELQARPIVRATLLDHRDAALTAPLQSFFDEFELERLALGDPDRLAKRQDLAMALWRASPLSDFEGSSAVLVWPGDGEASMFFFGLPIEAGSAALGPDDSRWPVRGSADLAGLREGNAALLSDGRFWGEVLYWWRGIDLDARAELGSADLAGSLLQRGAAETLPDALGSRTPRFAIRAPSQAVDAGVGEPVGTGVGEPLGTGVGAPLEEWVRDRESRSWQLTSLDHGQQGDELLRVGWFPVAEPLPALRAVGLHAVALILALLAVAGVAVLVAMTMPALRGGLRRFFSSYSRKLVALCTLLLIVPVALLNLVLFQSVGDRLSEGQRANGEAALRSAVRIMEDYLPGLKPGVAILAELDNELMTWLSEVVAHEVNLYWRGGEIASSRRELFDAGLLPKRIPGEVFSRLALAGEEVAARINRAGTGPEYLELYASVALPEEEGGRRLFLSVPLLAQQEEAAREVTQLAQQTLIVTAFLLALLVMVGSRLAAAFAAPITELMQGMGRIAGGSRSLGFSPSEPELAALAVAIDDMAERVAEGRERLIRDKQLIEGVMANINSAVISIGRDSRVQMCNRLARELLAIEVGQPIAELAEAEIADSLSELIRTQPAVITRKTAQLPGPDGEAEHEWTVVWVPVSGTGDPAALLVVEDITEILRGQRLEAWAEMARMIAHEVKNPLTPIRLSAEHLQRVYQTAPERLDEVFDQCVANILDQVAELRDTAAEFSTFSRIPNADLQNGDLRAAVERVVDGYRTSPPEGVAMSMELGSQPLEARFDERLVGRAVRNLLENSIHASAGEGKVRVQLIADGRKAHIVVGDRGPGVRPEDLERIFEPSFSTSSGGTGLGLAITRRIAEEHGGSVTAQNRSGGGLAVVLELPIETVSRLEDPDSQLLGEAQDF